MWSSRLYLATASPPSRPRSGGPPTASDGPGRSSCGAWAIPVTWPRAATRAPASPRPWAARLPEGLLGIHLNFLRQAVGNVSGLPADSEEERAALGAINAFRTSGYGYFLEQTTRPQTIGYALLDSPVALAAWMLDHDTDSYYKISRAFLDGPPAGNLTRDHILDNITLYWLTGTGASTARSYWEGGQAATHAAGQAAAEVALPVGFTTFPGEIFRAPRSWVEKLYPQLMYFHEVDRGGHFAAWEEPQLFSEEVRAAFRPLREGKG